MNGAQRATLIVMVVAIGATIVWAFLPLPGQTFGGEPATCGPGSSSSSAVMVKLFPDSVVSGTPSGDVQIAEAKAFEDQCAGVADTRLEIVGVVIAGVLLVGWIVFAIAGAGPETAAGRAP